MPVVTAAATAARTVAVTAACMSDTGAGRLGSRHAVAGTDRPGRDRSTAGKGISDRLPGHRIRTGDRNTLCVIFHLCQIHRTADDIQVRQAQKQNAFPDRSCESGPVSGNCYLSQRR